MTRYSFLLLFLLPQPILGQTTGTLFITEDTTLTENHEGNIIIGANDVTLDCHGFTVSGSGDDFGIELANRSGVRVRRCNVQGFIHGFDITFSSNNRFEENMSENNVPRLDGSGGFGFRISDSSNNTFTENMSANRRLGFLIRSSSSNTFTKNISENNGRDGFRIQSSSNNTFAENISGSNNRSGFRIEDSSSNTFAENISENNFRRGFRIDESSSNTFTKNISENNAGAGFLLRQSGGNTFTKNTVTANGDTGFFVNFLSSLNTFIENEGCGNAFFDAFDAIFGNNVWVDNDFCTSSGF